MTHSSELLLDKSGVSLNMWTYVVSTVPISDSISESNVSGVISVCVCDLYIFSFLAWHSAVERMSLWYNE